MLAHSHTESKNSSLKFHTCIIWQVYATRGTAFVNTCVVTIRRRKLKHTQKLVSALGDHYSTGNHTYYVTDDEHTTLEALW